MAKKIKIKIARIVASVSIGIISSYSLWVVIFWNWNMGEWNMSMRVFFVLTALVIMAVIYSILFIPTNNKQQEGEDFFDGYD